MDHPSEIKAINSRLEEYMQNVNSKFEAISEEISTNKAYAILVLEEIITDLRKGKNRKLTEKMMN